MAGPSPVRAAARRVRVVTMASSSAASAVVTTAPAAASSGVDRGGGNDHELTNVGRELAGEVQRRRDDPLAEEMTHAAVAGSAADGGRGTVR